LDRVRNGICRMLLPFLGVPGRTGHVRPVSVKLLSAAPEDSERETPVARILVVDDSSFMRTTLQYLLERAGHKVVGLATGGREAVDLYQRLQPDLVTMDIVMDDMDGIEALRRIREMDPGARVVMVTIQHQEQLEKEARKLGACGYLKKPLKEAEILETLDIVLPHQKMPS
jgi:two-component system chemotaxis response regulator CheY